jgi:hypothetical protein
MKNKALKTIEYNGQKVFVHQEFEDIIIVSKSKEKKGMFSIKKEKK